MLFEEDGKASKIGDTNQFSYSVEMGLWKDDDAKRSSFDGKNIKNESFKIGNSFACEDQMNISIMPPKEEKKEHFILDQQKSEMERIIEKKKKKIEAINTQRFILHLDNSSNLPKFETK
jgi:hypothetical protein